MPPSAQVRSEKFDFEHFINHVFRKFTDAFVKEMIDAFSKLKFWSVFGIFATRKLLQSVTGISSYRNHKITARVPIKN